MTGAQDLAQDVSGELAALVILDACRVPGAVVSYAVANALKPCPKRLDLALRPGEPDAVPAKSWKPEQPAHRAPGTSRSAQRTGYCHAGATRRGRLPVSASCSSSRTTIRSTRVVRP